MQSQGPRSVFIYLLTFLTLYISALGAAILTWGLADHWFQDSLEYYYSNAPIRSGVSMLIVAFPAFVYLNLYLRRQGSEGLPAERSTVKRVLTYLTLFFIAITVIVDLISVIYTFLGGDLTARFAVRAGGILLIAGFVYLYYLGELREPKEPEDHSSASDDKTPSVAPSGPEPGGSE